MDKNITKDKFIITYWCDEYWIADIVSVTNKEIEIRWRNTGHTADHRISDVKEYIGRTDIDKWNLFDNEKEMLNYILKNV
jgi:hypothetical protein